MGEDERQGTSGRPATAQMADLLALQLLRPIRLRRRRRQDRDRPRLGEAVRGAHHQAERQEAVPHRPHLAHGDHHQGEGGRVGEAPRDRGPEEVGHQCTSNLHHILEVARK